MPLQAAAPNTQTHKQQQGTSAHTQLIQWSGPPCLADFHRRTTVFLYWFVLFIGLVRWLFRSTYLKNQHLCGSDLK
jgi:hypothetical protein